MRLLLIVGRGGRGPIAVTTFFGMCTAIAVWQIAASPRTTTTCRDAEEAVVEDRGGVVVDLTHLDVNVIVSAANS